MALFVSHEGLNADERDVITAIQRLRANALVDVMTGWPNGRPQHFANTGIDNPRKKEDEKDLPVRHF